MLAKFLSDPKAWDMYITGGAGTGKTTSLKEYIEYCQANDITYTVCAFTHKACDILRSKLPDGAIVTTLHKFLKKRPGVNEHALNKRMIDINVRQGKSVWSPGETNAKPQVLFIDEYSMIGEQDGMDIRAEQDPEYEGQPGMKVVWIGDPNQLPPVGDMQFVRPYGDYQLKLTKIHRQGCDNPLLEPLSKLVRMIEGHEQPSALKPNGALIRGVDIVSEYKSCTQDKVLLAYTNKRVEGINREIQGYEQPKIGDKLYSPTTKKTYIYQGDMDSLDYIQVPHSGEVLMMGSKYRTLEHLLKSGMCGFAKLEDEDGECVVHAYRFGHYQNKLMVDELKTTAASANRAIEQKYPQHKAAGWAKANWRDPLARTRAKAWRDYFSYNENVICLDFAHATTVHKSQGSTYNTVFVDTDDLHTAASIDVDQYLKLMYVALSRASNCVYTT